MEQELQDAVELAAQWSASVIELEVEPGFIASFESDEEARLYTLRLNRATRSLVALRDQRFPRAVRVTPVAD